ncbi:MAG: iron-containing alcohol dehydrogenase [bacterium]
MFEFYSAGRLIFGTGSFSQLGPVAKSEGNTALIVLGKNALRQSGIVNRLVKQLEENNIQYTFFEGLAHEPDVETIDKGVELAKSSGCQLIIGIGGGSVLDTGKAIAGMVTNDGTVIDYLEGVGRGKQFVHPALPYIAIPTTSGTGSEVTKNAVISSSNPNNKYKVSIRSPLLIPKIALLDPELTVSLPPEPTAYSGLDALTQLIEPYVSNNANPFTDTLAISGIKLVGESLSDAYQTGDNLAAREKMMLAALFSGYALANAGLGAVHALARPLGAYYLIPHGLACAILLPVIMELNLKYRMDKYAEIGIALTGKPFENEDIAAYAGLDAVQKLNQELKVPKDFKAYQIKPADIPLLIEGAQGASLRDNPRELAKADLTALLHKLI